ncbi:MAG: hypothetical protein ACJA1F_001281 [Paracoccaceae bacterium]|jgi:hypothetical protein|tara:strand:- start:825 stop:1481 length:657 start_codon:yes stop_codon:yes gene_type:complete
MRLLLLTGFLILAAGTVALTARYATTQKPDDIRIEGIRFLADDHYARRLGGHIKARFGIVLPKTPNDTHEINIVEQSEGGIAQFNFLDPDGVLLESLFISAVDLPMNTSPQARLDESARRLHAEAPAALSRTFTNVSVTRLQPLLLRDSSAMELRGTYISPVAGQLFDYHFVTIPHPEKVESLYAVVHIRRLGDSPTDDSRSMQALGSLEWLDRANAQ